MWYPKKTSFTQFLRNRFQDFQDTGVLNVSCPIHKECVQFCLLSVIQHQLDMFAENWHSHRIRNQRAEVVKPSSIPDMLYYETDYFLYRAIYKQLTIFKKYIQRILQSMAVAMNLLTL